jgi:hypothetical protein
MLCDDCLHKGVCEDFLRVHEVSLPYHVARCPHRVTSALLVVDEGGAEDQRVDEAIARGDFHEPDLKARTKRLILEVARGLALQDLAELRAELWNLSVEKAGEEP